MSQASTVPAGRYPDQHDPRWTRRILMAGSVVVVILGLVIAYVGYRKFAAQPVSGATAGYELIDPSTAAVDVTVTRQNPAQAVSCIVYVKDRDGTEIGRREFYVPPAHDAVVTVTARVHTNGAPAVGQVFGCGTAVPAYLDR
ncbi:DUF4307 domain-containing protein [Tsukamurella soli]|uniref:DUF4307 domain-containing protein n=1 Tax=Tsukamurella soli TaxID=644556 RepID=A0ABP8JWI4_9ACTN